MTAPQPHTPHATAQGPVVSYPSARYPVVQRQLRPVRTERATAHDGRLADRAAVAGPHLAFLAGHLTARDRWLARVVAEHRVFTSTQLAQLAFGSARTANQRLLQLYQWRVLDRFQPLLAVGTAPMHYVLDVAGAAVLAAEDGVDQLDGYRHDRAVGIGHSLRLSHTIGVNGLYAALVAVARHSATPTPTDADGRGGRAVTVWWPETRAAKLWGDLARPDAYVGWREGNSEIDFFLEYDTGTESLVKVAGKLHDYARLAAATGIATPVLFWFPTRAREANARAAFAATHAALDHPDSVPVATTSAAEPTPTSTMLLTGGRSSAETFVPDSPAGARWLPLLPGLSADRDRDALRVRLARLAWPHTHSSPSVTTPPDGETQAPRPGAFGGLAEPEPMPPAGQSTHTARLSNVVSDGVLGDPRRRG